MTSAADVAAYIQQHALALALSTADRRETRHHEYGRSGRLLDNRCSGSTASYRRRKACSSSRVRCTSSSCRKTEVVLMEAYRRLTRASSASRTPRHGTSGMCVAPPVGRAATCPRGQDDRPRWLLPPHVRGGVIAPRPSRLASSGVSGFPCVGVTKARGDNDRD